MITNTATATPGVYTFCEAVPISSDVLSWRPCDGHLLNPALLTITKSWPHPEQPLARCGAEPITEDGDGGPTLQHSDDRPRHFHRSCPADDRRQWGWTTATTIGRTTANAGHMHDWLSHRGRPGDRCPRRNGDLHHPRHRVGDLRRDPGPQRRDRATLGPNTGLQAMWTICVAEDPFTNPAQPGNHQDPHATQSPPWSRASGSPTTWTGDQLGQQCHRSRHLL